MAPQLCPTCRDRWVQWHCGGQCIRCARGTPAFQREASTFETQRARVARRGLAAGPRAVIAPAPFHIRTVTIGKEEFDVVFDGSWR